MAEDLPLECEGEPEPAPSTGALSAERAWRGLVVLLAAMFCIELAVGMARLAVPFLGISLGASPLVLGYYGAVMAGTYGLMAPVSGRVSDRYGRKIAALLISVVGLAGVIAAYQKSPYAVLILLVPFAASLGFFWPPVQAWIGDLVSGTGKLHRVLGNFNLLWTSALMVGPAACGYLWKKGPHVPFIVAAAVIWASAAVMLFFVPTRRRAAPDAEESGGEAVDDGDRVDERADGLLPLAWAANFVGYSSVGIVRSIFPKLAAELGFSQVTTGWITAAFCAGQLAAFAILRQTTKWQYRRVPMILGMAAGMIGMGGVYFGNSPAVFTVCFIVAGAGVGFAYVGSLFYSLRAPQGCRGRRCGVHEGMVGAGGALGPLIAGKVGMLWGVRTSFGVEGLIFAAATAVFVGYSIAARLRKPT